MICIVVMMVMIERSDKSVVGVPADVSFGRYVWFLADDV